MQILKKFKDGRAGPETAQQANWRVLCAVVATHLTYQFNLQLDSTNAKELFRGLLLLKDEGSDDVQGLAWVQEYIKHDKKKR